MQSWKERYKKNCVRLDGRIDTVIAEKGYTVKSKTAYRNDRRLNKHTHTYALEGEEEEEDPDEQGEFATSEDEEESPPPRKRQKHFKR
ncbi:uncharacterized protein PHACADRAFT_265675 [Phanerochaete carnosa HHB-10118-sp]|uniref:Uncharacterized protein n=1 Tax=Phanerochaete carnosa (strain HHB-10118-sp) TaxID=650164 RepID=K5VE94_PHACS|nr:uncharacterized protein PHACADRAFT_265675 [Phanerochaete carnosa HHB-10118-sp]EKM49463.1 hypothetical protein PHACADRAFT_265675 [Phanerochaete carnosa HHB-10118-sp]